MDTQAKLLDLFGGVKFKVIDSGASVEEFKEITQYNQGQYARIEAMGEQYEERILDLICLVIAEKLYPLVISRFGDTSEYSLHRILNECFYTPEMKSEWGACKQTALTALSGDGLDAKQIEIISNVIDNLPETIIDLLVWIAGRLKVIPMQEVTSVSKILVQMMKEGSYADNTGFN